MSPPSSTELGGTLAPVVLIYPGKYAHPNLLSNIRPLMILGYFAVEIAFPLLVQTTLGANDEKSEKIG